MWPSLEWKENRLVLIDQRHLPYKQIYVECRSHEDVARSIEKMIIRGAPAIGVAAAYGVALGIASVENESELDSVFRDVHDRLSVTRPTARNLFWALERMEKKFKENRNFPLDDLKTTLIKEARSIEKEDVEMNRKIGKWGKSLIKDGTVILTHCNAGALATAGYGTALGVIRAAVEEGKSIRVYADETRPVLQGARLTCWELMRDNIPVTLITDSTAGLLMKQKKISLVITGADRITRNGDVANKIGTYSAAVLAKENNIPFYVAAPTNTIDFSLKRGDEIPIEQRDADEVRKIGDKLIAPGGVPVENPAFDVTPAAYVTAIISQHGIARPPYEKNLSVWE